MQKEYPKPPFPEQQQPYPGLASKMDPVPDHGEETYRGNGRLKGKKALITGADSGIGRAVAIAFAREGADVAISYLNEHEDAEDVKRVIEADGRQCLLLPGDIAAPEHCRDLVAKTVDAFGRIDVLVNNAAHQSYFESLEEIPDEEWETTMAVNISAMFYITKAAVPHMKSGSSIINTASKQADEPSPELLAYAVTKGAIQNFSAGLCQLLAKEGIRVNTVAPGPVWTPLGPASLPASNVAEFGKQVPFKRPAQPVELAPPYVMLASDEASYISGATIAVTGGKPVM
ncbi:SDR family oxidoreductase [Devosia sp. ZB163]|uniref:SDR family oxidoreductase n=1 Tax=Devosia sp. ZB163 TaxID=3025938 RepID=UPI002360C731|nr:SDR family oxidoreductase [Devosia sp. ZB163]MDC9824241.1 SDR family oxidoreductase [Devosia sp. ZB163]